jgi:adenine phosphoribosyltransferase
MSKDNDYFITIPNFPINGFYFPDITPIIENHIEDYCEAINFLCEPFLNAPPNAIVCIEALGYILGASMASILNCRIVLARKAGKLPRSTYSEEYSMCYSPKKILEINTDAIHTNDTVLIVDDFLASGGTFLAATNLVRRAGGIVLGGSFVVEITDMHARFRDEFFNIPINSYYKITFNNKINKWEIN